MIKHFKIGDIVKVMDENDKTRNRMYSAKILRSFENEAKYEVQLLEYPGKKIVVVYEYDVFPHYPRFREGDYILFENEHRRVHYEVLGFNKDHTEYILSEYDFLTGYTGEPKSSSVGYIDSYSSVQSRILNGDRLYIGDDVEFDSDKEVWTIFSFLAKGVLLRKETATIELRDDDIVRENLRKHGVLEAIELYKGFKVKVGDYVYYTDPLYMKSKFFNENAVWRVTKIRPDCVELFTQDGTRVIGVNNFKTKVDPSRFIFIKPTSKEEWYKRSEGLDMKLNTLNLTKEQIKNLIDVALTVRDKQWFNELVERLNKMQ